MPTIDDLRKNRLKKLELIRGLVGNPYPATVEREQTINKAKGMDDQYVATAGRIRGFRGHGKIAFLDLEDASGKIQIVLKTDLLNGTSSRLTEYLDDGDFISVRGKVGKTQAGEISVFAENIQILTKALRPLPSQWFGLKNIEERYRQSYVDLLVNPEVKEIFRKRIKVVKFLRDFLDKHEFIEVETPILQPIYGGASAKPFITHHNALDIDLYLRISDELYLKRLIVAGLEKVYEIGHDFRNEGVDRGHNPEFTMLEFYWAYADYEQLMEFTEEMISTLVKEINGNYEIEYQGKKINFKPPWPRITYRTAILEKCPEIDLDIIFKSENPVNMLTKLSESNGVQFNIEDVGFGSRLDRLYKQKVRPYLIGPLFLTDRPTEFVTLAKRKPDNPHYTSSFQLLVASEELINAYNELNDPQDQAKRWKESEELGKSGKEEHEAFDYDYIRALEYGMPPTAGWGMGIDRLVTILVNQKTIKDVILFPTLRPEA